MTSKDIKKLRNEAVRQRHRGNVIGALQLLDKIIGLKAASANDWYMTGALLSDLGEYAQAIGAFESCLTLHPKHWEATYDLGRALYKLGESDRAIRLLEKAAATNGLSDMWLGLATIAPGAPTCDHNAVRKLRERYASLVRKAESTILTESVFSKADIRSDGLERPLRIGYLSAHWQDANYMKPVWPLINAHGGSGISVCLFDDTPTASQEWNWLTNKEVETYRVTELSNRQTAQLIRDQSIDVLVDLSAYSKPERLGVYVHRPAPIQVAWFNMYATSGFTEFDYIIGDKFVIQDSEEIYYTEKVLRLPLSYLTFQTNHRAPDIDFATTRKMDEFCFGCLGTQYKITPAVIDAWAAILKSAGKSKLLLANRELKSICNREYLTKRFQERGVTADRLVLLPPAEHYEFLKYYDRIDLALDTFPYNGGTTTMEALWQGVPVLTFLGDRWASRTSSSILGFSHLPQFIAQDVSQYILLAVEHATQAEKFDSLQSIRSSMRENIVATMVCDSVKLAREMESLFSQIRFLK